MPVVTQRQVAPTLSRSRQPIWFPTTACLLLLALCASVPALAASDAHRLEDLLAPGNAAVASVEPSQAEPSLPSLAVQASALHAFAASVRHHGTLASWTGEDPCLLDRPWMGVACSESSAGSLAESTSATPPQVVRLELDSYGLEGDLGAAGAHLAPLSSLRVLDVSNNQLHGELPADWARLRALRVLAASNQGLEGLLPASWSALSSLRAVFLDGTRLSGAVPSSWEAGLPALRVLDLSGNERMCLSGDADEEAALAALIARLGQRLYASVQTLGARCDANGRGGDLVHPRKLDAWEQEEAEMERLVLLELLE
ncbi:hypothetical protein H632_c2995p0, partial [Helicosporidium sp. ATCC 50920]